MKILVSLINSKTWLSRSAEEKMDDICGYTYYNAITYFEVLRNYIICFNLSG